MVKERLRPFVSLLALALVAVFASEALAIPTLRATPSVRSTLSVHKKKQRVARTRISTRSSRLSKSRVKATRSTKARKVAAKKQTKKTRIVERIHWLRQAAVVPAPRMTAKQMTKAQRMFASGKAASYSPAMLLASKVFVSQPLIGGIFKRDQAVKFIVMHSTETASEADAPRVIRSWNNRGLRHPGTQYMVDRDGLIYQTVDPSYGAVHVNFARTRFGVNNHNSVGIEIVRSGDQQYTELQKKSVARLVVYLQQRFKVPDAAVVAHGYIQPSNRTDPVAFDWLGFGQLVAAIRPDVRIAQIGKPNVAIAKIRQTNAPVAKRARAVTPSKGGKTNVATATPRRADGA